MGACVESRASSPSDMTDLTSAIVSFARAPRLLLRRKRNTFKVGTLSVEHD